MIYEAVHEAIHAVIYEEVHEVIHVAMPCGLTRCVAIRYSTPFPLRSDLLTCPLIPCSWQILAHPNQALRVLDPYLSKNTPRSGALPSHKACRLAIRICQLEAVVRL